MSEFTIRVQWSRGAVLPVLVRGDTTVRELSRLLRFACSPHDEIVLNHNGMPLNPDMTLDMQMVKKNDVLDAIITRKAKTDTGKGLGAKIDSIVLEAARINDRRLDALEMSPLNKLESYKNKKSSSDDDYIDFIDNESNIDYEPIDKISTEPLPTFWKKEPKKNPLDSSSPTKLLSIEEAGQFLEKEGWSSWIW